MCRQKFRYEWDETKRRINLEKHGVDFSDVERFEWGDAVIISNDRHGEVRFVAYGYINNRLHVVVYTIKTNITRRVISIRKANPREMRTYAKA